MNGSRVLARPAAGPVSEMDRAVDLETRHLFPKAFLDPILEGGAA